MRQSARRRPGRPRTARPAAVMPRVRRPGPAGLSRLLASRAAALAAWLSLPLGGALAAAACGDDDAAGPRQGRTIEVEVFDFGFRPVTVSARAGDRIRWTQTGQVLHTVTSGEPGTPGAGQLFDEVVEEPGDVVEVTLSSPGPLPYFCRPHQFMTGSVQVSP